MKRIIPGLYYFTGLIVGRVYAIRDPDGLTIVDAGLRLAAYQVIRQLRAAGYKPSEVKRILVTHAHPDHVGGLPRLQRWTGAEVIASAIERPMVEGKAPVPRRPLESFRGVAKLARPPQVTLGGAPVHRAVEEGDVLGEAMGGLQVIATPGHTPGHVSFWQPQRRILFCGDVIAASFRLHLPSLNWTVDMSENRRSIRRIAALEPQLVCFGHGEPLGRNAAQMIRDFACRVCES